MRYIVSMLALMLAGAAAPVSAATFSGMALEVSRDASCRSARTNAMNKAHAYCRSRGGVKSVTGGGCSTREQVGRDRSLVFKSDASYGVQCRRP